MHILFLSDNFPPEGNAPATRTYEHTRVWVKKGHQVTVITCAPNFPEGKVFHGYTNHWYDVSEYDGIKVIRVKTYIAANKGVFKRTLDFVSFMISSLFAGLFQRKIDIVIGTSPQFFTVISACLLAKLKRVPFVFELRDIWPASITAVEAVKKGAIINFFEKLEMSLYRQADLIVSVTNSFKTELIKRGIAEDKITVVLNGVELTTYTLCKFKHPRFVQEVNLDGKFVVGYVGTHGMAHALDKVVETAELLKDNKTVIFLFVGGGAYKEKLNQMIMDSGLENIISIPRQPKSEIPSVWSLCDVSLISLKDVPLFKSVVPSKIFESMGMGLPMIISMPEGEATSIIKESTSGLIVKPESPHELAETILVLLEDSSLRNSLSKNSLQASKSFSRSALSAIMLENLEALVKSSTT